MSQPELPLDLSNAKHAAQPVSTLPDQARLRRPVRNQVEMMLRDLDSLIAENHPVRAIWDFLQRLDLSDFYSSIRAVLDAPGRPASDPQVLLALWIYATVDGVGTARRLDRLCREHDAYRWLCGGVPVNYHTLSDFRMAHQEALDPDASGLTEIVATLMDQKLVTLKQVAQDGVRVRASAGGGSFHRRNHLEQYLVEAEEQVRRLAEERDHPDPKVNLREQVAQERAARERMERVEAALRQLPAVQAAKERQQKKPRRQKVTEARASTTPIASGRQG